jgi:hypothetical protein
MRSDIKMHYNIKLFEELETDTNIGWWNYHREKVNEAIRMVNNWQINHKQDRYEAELVIAKVNSIRRWSKEECDEKLSGWQLEILDEIENHVKEVIN